MARAVGIKSASGTEPPADAEHPPDTKRPEQVTVALPAKSRRKRKYSKNLRGIQEFERHASRAVHRLARSVEAGVETWRKATDGSARRRRDGAARDALDNFAKATAKQLRVVSSAPQNLARAARSLRIRKTVRRLLPIM